MPLSRASPRKNLVNIARLVLLRDADPLVAYLDPHGFAAARAADLDRAALGGVLDRIPEEVPEHLGDSVAVAAHGQGVGGDDLDVVAGLVSAKSCASRASSSRKSKVARSSSSLPDSMLALSRKWSRRSVSRCPCSWITVR